MLAANWERVGHGTAAQNSVAVVSVAIWYTSLVALLREQMKNKTVKRQSSWDILLTEIW